MTFVIREKHYVVQPECLPRLVDLDRDFQPESRLEQRRQLNPLETPSFLALHVTLVKESLRRDAEQRDPFLPSLINERDTYRAVSLNCKGLVLGLVLGSVK